MAAPTGQGSPHSRVRLEFCCQTTPKALRPGHSAGLETYEYSWQHRCSERITAGYQRCPPNNREHAQACSYPFQTQAMCACSQAYFISLTRDFERTSFRACTAEERETRSCLSCWCRTVAELAVRTGHCYPQQPVGRSLFQSKPAVES